MNGSITIEGRVRRMGLVRALIRLASVLGSVRLARWAVSLLRAAEGPLSDIGKWGEATARMGEAWAAGLERQLRLSGPALNEALKRLEALPKPSRLTRLRWAIKTRWHLLTCRGCWRCAYLRKGYYP